MSDKKAFAKMTVLAIAFWTSGCAVTPEIAQSYTDADLCWNLYDQVSFTGRSEAAIRNEVARRGLDCRAMGELHAQKMRTLQMILPPPPVVIASPPIPPAVPSAPTSVNCTSTKSANGTVYTSCR